MDTTDALGHGLLEFSVHDAGRFSALCAAFSALNHDKEIGVRRAEEDWLEVFDDEALAQFWWPTTEDRANHSARWDDPPSWDFLSMIDAFMHGEYSLLSCSMVDDHYARLEFAFYAFPYGGCGCMAMLIKAFGFHVVAEDVGFGYRRCDEEAECRS